MIIEGNTHNPYGFPRRFGAPAKLAPVAYRDHGGRLRGIGMGTLADLGDDTGCVVGALSQIQQALLDNGMVTCAQFQQLLSLGAGDSQYAEILSGDVDASDVINALETSGTPMNPASPPAVSPGSMVCSGNSLLSFGNPAPPCPADTSACTQSFTDFLEGQYECPGGVLSAAGSSPYPNSGPTTDCTTDPINWLLGTPKCPTDTSACSQSTAQWLTGEYGCPSSLIPKPNSSNPLETVAIGAAVLIFGAILFNKIL